jgi:hypothetical protein
VVVVIIIVITPNGDAVGHSSIGSRYNLSLPNDPGIARTFSTLATFTAETTKSPGYQSLRCRYVNDLALAVLASLVLSRLFFLLLLIPGPGQYLHLPWFRRRRRISLV